MDYFEKKNDFEINPVFICNLNVETYKYKNDSISGKTICRHTFEKIS